MTKVFKPKTYETELDKSKQVSENPKRYTPVCWDTWEVDRIRITYDKCYQDDISKMGPLTKKKIKSLINDIKKGHLYTDGPGNPGSDTHILINKSKKKYLVWSKSISTIDRITYAIFEPVMYTEEGDEEPKLTLRVTILSCKEHKTGKGKSYSDTKEEP